MVDPLTRLAAGRFGRTYRRGVAIALRPVYAFYEARLAAAVLAEPRPRHVAVIMDGNRRWAAAEGYADPGVGHRRGAENALELIDWCADLGIFEVTLWALSIENLDRAATEVATITDVASPCETRSRRARRPIVWPKPSRPRPSPPISTRTGRRTPISSSGRPARSACPASCPGRASTASTTSATCSGRPFVGSTSSEPFERTSTELDGTVADLRRATSRRTRKGSSVAAGRGSLRRRRYGCEVVSATTETTPSAAALHDLSPMPPSVGVRGLLDDHLDREQP